jgi:hypothetical protein
MTAAEPCARCGDPYRRHHYGRECMAVDQDGRCPCLGYVATGELQPLICQRHGCPHVYPVHAPGGGNCREAGCACPGFQFVPLRPSSSSSGLARASGGHLPT